MRTKNTILILSVTLLITTGNGIAQKGAGQMRCFPEGPRLLMGIPDLSDEQLNQIKDLHTAHLKEIRPLKNDVNINNAVLQALLTEDDPNLGKINELIEKNGNLLTEIRKKQVAHKMEIRSLLTDDQKVFFDSRMQRLGRAAGAKSQGRGMGPGRGSGYGQEHAEYGCGYRCKHDFAGGGWGRGFGRGID